MSDEEILKALKLDTIDDESKVSIIDSVRNTVELRVIAVITEMMTDEQSVRFDELVQAGDNQAIWDWLRNDIVGVDVSEVYEATLRDYIEERLADEFIPKV